VNLNDLVELHVNQSNPIRLILDEVLVIGLDYIGNKNENN
jgi:hypothetical protein